MDLNIVATYNSDKLFTGITQIPAGTELIEGQTDILPKNQTDNYFTGTAWIHKKIPTQEQMLLMNQQAQIISLVESKKQLQKMVMNQQAQIMQLKKEGN